MMNIIDRHLIVRLLVAFLFMLFAVMVIVVIVDLVEKMEDFTERKPPMAAILLYYWRLMLYFGTMFAPICVFLSVIFFTSQMAQRSELVAMLAGGVSFYRILFTYLIVGCILSACSFYLTGYIVPQATANRVEFEYKYCKKKKVSRDRDIYKRVVSDKKNKTEVYVYIQYFDNKEKEAHSFSMTKFVNNQMTNKLSAEKAVWVDSLEKWTLFDMRTRALHEKGEVLAFFPKKDTTFNLTPDDIFIVEQKAETMNTPELIQFTKQEEVRGSEILKDLYTERYVRHASPFAFIILSMIGFAMSSRKSRGGTALQIGLGVVISILYIAMLLIGKLFVSETFPAWLAAWLPNIIFFPIAIILLRVAPK